MKGAKTFTREVGTSGNRCCVSGRKQDHEGHLDRAGRREEDITGR
jgi:hypothetical protein